MLGRISHASLIIHPHLPRLKTVYSGKFLTHLRKCYAVNPVVVNDMKWRTAHIFSG